MSWTNLYTSPRQLGCETPSDGECTELDIGGGNGVGSSSLVGTRNRKMALQALNVLAERADSPVNGPFRPVRNTPDWPRSTPQYVQPSETTDSDRWPNPRRTRALRGRRDDSRRFRSPACGGARGTRPRRSRRRQRVVFSPGRASSPVAAPGEAATPRPSSRSGRGPPSGRRSPDSPWPPPPGGWPASPSPAGLAGCGG